MTILPEVLVRNTIKGLPALEALGYHTCWPVYVDIGLAPQPYREIQSLLCGPKDS